MTLRHLLTHTSGIDGDVFTDTGRGDDCLEKYVELLADVAQNHPLGATWSYCNSGWSLLGRVIEKVTGQTWDQAMKERLFTPLGLDHTVTLAEEAILFAAAVGHVEADGQQVPTPVWDLPRSVGPAGLIKSTVRDVLRFARMHLSAGRAADGTAVLSPESTEAMTRHEADLPDKFILGDSWGLGWIRFGWDGERLVGHDGNTIGQAGFLRLLPGSAGHGASRSRCSPTVATPATCTRTCTARSSREVAGVEMSEPFAPPAEPVEVDIAPYVGTYARSSVRMEVLAGQDGDGPHAAHHGARPARRDGARPGRRVPARPGRPGAVRGEAARGRDLGTGDVLRAADRGALRALRRPRDPEGRLMDASEKLSGLLADTRELVECESPSDDLAAVARSADVVAAPRRAPARRRARADRAGRAHPPAVAAGQRTLAGAAARPPRHRLAARVPGRPIPARSREASCAGPAAST